jgi:hypothetical protein
MTALKSAKTATGANEMIEKTLGHYRVGEQLGRGSVGEI